MSNGSREDLIKRAAAVALAALWAHLVLNASEAALTGIIPYLHGALLYTLPALPW